MRDHCHVTDMLKSVGLIWKKSNGKLSQIVFESRSVTTIKCI